MFGYEVYVPARSWSFNYRAYPGDTWVPVETHDDVREIQRRNPEAQCRAIGSLIEARIPDGNPSTEVVLPSLPPAEVVPAAVKPESDELASVTSPLDPVAPSADASTLPNVSFEDEDAVGSALEERIRVVVPKLAPEVLAGALAIIEQKPADLVEALQSVKGIGKSTAVKIAEAVTNG